MPLMVKSRHACVAALVTVGAALLPTAAASATEGFTCPPGSDGIDVPYAFAPDNQPLLAGTVCVFTGTTRFQSVDVAAGWTAEIKSDGSKGRTDVRFTQTDTGDRVELRYEPGRTEIK
jgi:hypothetical protein